MSEEIIIDGINVAECRFLDEWKHCNICNELCDSKCLIVEDIECKTYDDCYYKQLKRLQAENEELKAKFNNNSLCNRIQIYEADEARTRQALEEIREYLQQFKKKKSNFYTLNDVVTDIAGNIEKIISEVLK